MQRVTVPHICRENCLCEDHNPPQVQRGRPKKTDGELRQLDVRITPKSQERPDFPAIFKFEDFPKCLIAEEGGVGTDTRLHYHLYIETLRSDTYLKKVFTQTAGGKGNQCFSVRAAHEGTKGYAVKDERIVHTIGFSPAEVQEILNESEEYRRTLERTKKQNTRSKEKYLTLATVEVRELLTRMPPGSFGPEYIVEQLLSCYARDNKRFPPRHTIETTTMTLLYPYHPSAVRQWYANSFLPR